MLGTSGSACDRILLVTASARSLPSLICGTAGGNEVKAMGVCPASVAPTAKPALLKGTCTRSRPSNRRKCSPMRCGGVPVPGEAKLYLAEPQGPYNRREPLSLPDPCRYCHRHLRCSRRRTVFRDVRTIFVR